MKKKLFKSLPWTLPVILIVFGYLPASGGWYGLFMPVCLGLAALIAAGVTKLFFPGLFDNLFTVQKRLVNYSTDDYNQFYVRMFQLGWLVFFSVWALLTWVKFH